MKTLIKAGKADDLAKDARSVLLHIGTYVDLDGIAWPSPSLIADDTGYSERAVRNALAALRAAGIVLAIPPPAARVAFPELGAKAPKHLPLWLLWPIAPREARMRALAALNDPPVTPNLAVPVLGPCFITSPLDVGKEFGPYTAADLERFARDHSGADAWMVREEGSEPKALTNWYSFAAGLPRVPPHRRLHNL